MANTTISQRLHDQLSQLIAITEPGTKLPSEPSLAESLHVSRATLREAMRTFEIQGLIQRKQGAGTFVNLPPHVLESGLEILESIERIAIRSGLSTSVSDLQVDQRTSTPSDCQIFSLDTPTDIIQVSRVIRSENRPSAFLIDLLPANIVPLEELKMGFSGSILDFLIMRGYPKLLSSRTEISAVPASSMVARSLGIQRGDVLLHFNADLFTTEGKIIDHSFSYFLPGYFRFHVIRRIGLNSQESKA